MTKAAADSAAVYSLADLVETIGDEYDRADAAIAAGKSLGPAIPWRQLSEMLDGYWPIGLVVAHGGPGAGKSAFGISAALSAQCPAVYLNAEMGIAGVVRRMLALESADFLGRLKRGKISGASIRARIKALGEQHPNLLIVDATTSAVPFEALNEQCREQKGQGDHLFLVADSIHTHADGLWPQLDEYARVSRAVGEWRKLAHKHGATVLAISERNRGGMRGGLASGAGTRKLEYGAEVVFELDQFDDSDSRAIQVNLTISKNRDGGRGVIGFQFDGPTQRFLEFGPAWTSAMPGQTPPLRKHRLAIGAEDLDMQMEIA